MPTHWKISSLVRHKTNSNLLSIETGSEVNQSTYPETIPSDVGLGHSGWKEEGGGWTRRSGKGEEFVLKRPNTCVKEENHTSRKPRSGQSITTVSGSPEN